MLFKISKTLKLILNQVSYVIFIPFIGNLGQGIIRSSSTTAIHVMTMPPIGYHKLSLDWPVGVTWSGYLCPIFKLLHMQFIMGTF